MNEITITDAYDLGELLRLALVRVAELEAALQKIADGDGFLHRRPSSMQSVARVALAAVRQEKP
jgi:hypothetical protein